jgi:hypothetical protein
MAKKETSRPAFIDSEIYNSFANAVDLVYRRERGALRRELETALKKHQKTLDKRVQKLNKLK